MKNNLTLGIMVEPKRDRRRIATSSTSTPSEILNSELLPLLNKSSRLIEPKAGLAKFSWYTCTPFLYPNNSILEKIPASNMPLPIPNFNLITPDSGITWLNWMFC